MNAMRPTTSKMSRVAPALLAAAVVSIVLGIVGMHALSTHGPFGNTDHSDMTSQATGQAANQVTGAHGDMSAGDHPADEGHSLGSMVMLCFAMLAAAAGALVLLLLGLRRRTRVWTHRLTAAPSVSRWVTARLGTGPPYVWEFSVIRC